MKNNRKNNISIYLLSFLIPIIIMLIVYAISKIYPFGDKTLLFRDLRGQYVSYFSAFRNALLGDGNLLYSFTKEMGGNMFGLTAYYMLSPFNIILALFPKSMITEAILVITLLKIGTCGLTLSIFLKKSFKNFGYFSIIFSSAYALMAYNTMYQSNIMWLDGVILLPLVLIGIDNIINKKKILLYIITLALCIITNFYIGFIICIFSVIYFIYRITILSIYNKKYFSKSVIYNRFKYFLVGSILGGALSSFVLIPTVYALLGGKAKFEFFSTPIQANFKMFDILSKFYINGLVNNDILKGLPNIYCGVFIGILFILYFFNKGIKRGEKSCSLIVVGILLVSFYVNKFDYIWHGFNKPVGFPYRYSFLFSFFMILLAYKAYINIKEISNKSIVITLISICVLSMVMFKLNYVYLSKFNVILSTILALAYSIFIIIKKDKISWDKLATFLIMILMLGELCIHALEINTKLDYAKRSEFVKYNSELDSILNNIKNKDSDFYRIDKNFVYNMNDPMLLNYNGLSHFSSMYKVCVKDFLGKMGYMSNKVLFGEGMTSTVTANSLLDVKYILSKENEEGLYNNYYKLLGTTHGINIYENPYYLPLGFMVNKDITNLNIKDEENPFKIQNDILNSMIYSNNENQYYRKVDYNIKLTNLTVKDIKGSKEYNKENKNKPAYIEFTMNNNSSNPLYAFIETNKIHDAQIYLNNKKITYFSPNNYKVIPLGKQNIAEKLNFKIELKKDKFNIKNQYFYYLNIKNYGKDYKEMSKNKYDINYFSNTDIKGTVNSSNSKNILYTSIPYDQGWTVSIDGNEVPKIKLLDSLIGVSVPNGVHEVEFKFVPEGLYLGSMISIVALGLIIIVCLYKKKGRN
ncbi:YfhO family protein [Clostridium sardiniense]|uniref:YfhO family protein n=1 Tax=Clostridium sardiniense TaxID=29369 RepID=UPI00195A8FCF|nr:YfhO family protein [Clostridium sardiniense]MBM7834098.1 putative membrane protein YfhO [Clostridium sardiniense]